MLEKEIERRLGEMIKRRGGLYYKFISPMNPGVPDRIVITPAGRIIFVELKADFGRLANIQKWQRSVLESHNAEVRVLKGWSAAKAFVEDVFPDGIQEKGVMVNDI